MPLCIKCNEREIFIKSRSLCSRCYNRIYADARRQDVDSVSDKILHLPQDAKKIKYFRELEFVKNYFTHYEWIAYPVMFYLPNGIKYTPDFYDKRRNVFIEVIGTRQAYSLNKSKYDLLRKEYPLLQFEIRNHTGEIHQEKEKTEENSN
jgi:hypothetical protein